MNEDFSQQRRSARAPAAKINGGFPINQPHTYQQTNVVQNNGTYHGLDPTGVPFQPASDGLERYRTPRTLNAPQYHDELVDIVQDYNIQHITETARLDHGQRVLARKVDDLQRLGSDIEGIKKWMSNLTPSQVADLAQKQIEAPKSGAEAAYDYYYTTEGCRPSEEMLAAHPKEKLATTYIEEAEKREASATALRKQALELCPDVVKGQASATRLQIEAAPVVVDQAPIPEFACCNTEFSAIGELVEHVERAHTAPEHRLSSQKRSKAVEIKSPPNGEVASSTGGQAVPLADVKQEDVKQEINKASVKDAGQNTPPWNPAAVLEMPIKRITVPDHMETFSFDFIRATFGGDYWSPGFYFVPTHSILPSKAYWIVDATHEPFLPTQPGTHGAKLTVFFNETISGEGEAPDADNYNNVPVFIKTQGKDEYSYFGNYSQLRFSDKVGYDTIASVIPKSVLQHHAERLAETGRPAWVTESLREHFWPKPKYIGPIPTDSAISSPAPSVQGGSSATAGMEEHVMKGLVAYAAELKDWEKDSRIRVNHLTKEGILKAFSLADAEEEPGLRLYWEYLQCRCWDNGFYKMLVGLKKSPVVKKEIGSTGKKRRQSPDCNDGSTAAKMGITSVSVSKPPPAEAVFKSTKGKAKEVMEEYPGPEAKTKFVRPDFNEKPVGSGAATMKVRNGVGSGAGKKSETMLKGASAAPPTGPKGDLKAAKEFSASVKKSAGGSIPPHLRGRK